VDRVAREQLLKWLRDALNRLQDPSYLRRSPLVALFAIPNRSDTPVVLRRILIETVESLEPAGDTAPESRAWRIYESVFYRYIEGFSQEDVADQLGISVRQLRREQRAAFEAMVYKLCERFDVEPRWPRETDVEIDVQMPTKNAALNEELAWLKNAPPERSTDLNQTLPTVVDLVQPLAAQHGVHLEVAMDDSLPCLSLDPVAFRQILLNLLSVAIPGASGNQITLLARPTSWEVEIEVRGRRASSELEAVSDSEEASMDIAQRLTGLCGGKLTVSTDGSAFSATLILPALEQLPVLAIDDNASALQLLQRYVTGTRYRLTGTRDPEEALNLAEKLSPQIIVLDVMMPRVDGWEILGRLRQHPLTSHIPVIVCTILAQKELALSLGASAFLCKPVTRQVFVAALDQQIERMGQELR
jgi:CheY-like chemotaxis protein/transcriptional regulator with XRE-family HTH domain